MQQRFHTRSVSVQDFEQWQQRGELILQPKFQRRDIWKPKARSYLIDTIIRGKPIPKLYMRQDIDPRARKTTREIVDGQQRLHTVLSFIKDGFKLSRVHNRELGNSLFSELDEDIQNEILKYEFVVDLLEDMPDADVYDVFARINLYNERLTAQELRNSRWFGDFKSSVYSLARDLVPFFDTKRIFSSRQIVRMAEAEFISELLLAIQEGIREGKRSVIDSAYKTYDNIFPNRDRHERRFKETIDTIGGIFGDDLQNSVFRATRLFYPLFCAVYHMQFGLLRLQAPKRLIRSNNYPKTKIILEEVHLFIRNTAAAEKAHEDVRLSGEDRKFYEAYSVHWVHATNRTILTQYLCRKLVP